MKYQSFLFHLLPHHHHLHPLSKQKKIVKKRKTFFLSHKLKISLKQEFTFTFLLSSRLFMRPHELLGTLLDMKADGEPLDDLVQLLKLWTRTFPYDFRDERMMSHIKHIAAR